MTHHTHRLRPSIIGMLGCLVWLGSVCTQAHAEPPTPIDSAHTAATWLQLQAQGTQASRQRQTLNGPAMGGIYRKFLCKVGNKGCADSGGNSGDNSDEGKPSGGGNTLSEALNSLGNISKP